MLKELEIMHAFGGIHFTNGLNLVDQHFEV